MNAKLWYVASPYTKYRHGYEIAYQRALAITVELLKHKIPVWSPIVYSHQFVAYGLPIEAKDWMFLDEAMIKACTGCIVYMMEGWEQSSGIIHEVQLFREQGKHIEYLPEDALVADIQALAEL